MTDPEIVRLCAEAMGRPFAVMADGRIAVRQGRGFYHPLDSDAQAMALLKKFELSIAWSWAHTVSVQAKPTDENPIRHECIHTDLNRAICLCVAQMQAKRCPTAPARALA